ncbi:ribonuclease H-like domain-containing protein, partial [Tanacetum coccineum]
RTMLADSKLPTIFWTEAVSTACYVLNRVSITNPHNKTPYELISGKVPQIGHLKPFGCQVSILNTSDYLGKFEGKADEGYLVGYAPNSKAYRVYNLTNKRVEETMNLRFLEDKPNVQGIGHEWYFDLDYLTDSLGYTRFKTDKPAGTQDHDSDSEVDEQVIVVPSFPSNSFAGPSSSNGPSVMERNADYAEELAKLQRQEYEAKDAAARYGYLFSQETAEILSQAEAEIRNQGVSADRDPAGIDSAGGVSAGSTSAGSDPAGGNPAGSSQPAGSDEPAGKGNPAVSTSVSADFIPVHADESTLPPGQSLGSSENTTRFPVPSDVCKDQLSSGIFTSSSYDDDFSATLTNLAPAVEVNPVPTKRVNTIHPQSQILGDLASPVLTRSRAQKSKFGESAFIGYIQDQQRTNHTDQLHCLFACFLSQLEPTSIAKALEDPDWVAAMQEEMQQFINQKVWRHLSLLPAGKIAIGTKLDFEEQEGCQRNSCKELKHGLCGWKSFWVNQYCLVVVEFKVLMKENFDMESVRTATTPYEAAKTKLKDETDPPVNLVLVPDIKLLHFWNLSVTVIMMGSHECIRKFHLQVDVNFGGRVHSESHTAASCTFFRERPGIMLMASVFLLWWGILLLVDSFSVIRVWVLLFARFQLLVGSFCWLNTFILLERMLRHRLTVPPSYCRDVVVAGNIIQTVQDGLRQAYECIASAPIIDLYYFGVSACTARQMVTKNWWYSIFHVLLRMNMVVQEGTALVHAVSFDAAVLDVAAMVSAAYIEQERTRAELSSQVSNDIATNVPPQRDDKKAHPADFVVCIALKYNFEKPSSHNEPCRVDAFRKQDREVHRD